MDIEKLLSFVNMIFGLFRSLMNLSGDLDL